MIGEYSLERLCDKYGISKDRIVNKNNNILDLGEYTEIDKTLNYLINELKITPNNIEKCPSILYKNVNAISYNIGFLKREKINFSSIETCMHVLSANPIQLQETYNYVLNNYGISAINRNTSILSCKVSVIKDVEALNINVDKNGLLSITSSIEFGKTTIEEIQKIIQSKEFKEHPELFTSEVLARSTLGEIQKIIQSKEFKEHPELFTSQVLARSTLEEIQKIIQSREFKEHRELFTSQVLAFSTLEEIQKIIQSREFKEYPELFTSTVLAHSTLEEIQKIIQSKEFKEHRELFTSTVLANSTLEKIQKIIQSKEFKEYPELFTSEVLAHSALEKIQKIIQSKEFKEYPELFTSQVLARSTLEEIQKIIQSKEFKEHPELFTSTVLAHSTLEEIQKIIQSKEFKEHPELFASQVLAFSTLGEIQKIIQSKEFKEHRELFTSTVLAHSTLEDIQGLLSLECLNEEKYRKLISPSIVSRTKSMITKLPLMIKLSEKYNIEDYITTNFLLHSPSQNYALINYLLDNNKELIIDGKLNSIFAYHPGVLQKKYKINLKYLMELYPFDEKVLGVRSL